MADFNINKIKTDNKNKQTKKKKTQKKNEKQNKQIVTVKDLYRDAPQHQ